MIRNFMTSHSQPSTDYADSVTPVNIRYGVKHRYIRYGVNHPYIRYGVKYLSATLGHSPAHRGSLLLYPICVICGWLSQFIARDLLVKVLSADTQDPRTLGLVSVCPGEHLGNVSRFHLGKRSEERRVGKECRSRWS